jgi:hypothetical protein
MDIRFGTWNITSLFRVGSLMTVLRELKLDLLGVQEVKWEGGGTEPAKYIFFCGKRNENLELGTVFFFFNKRILSAIKRVEFLSDRLSYILLRGH